MKIQNDIILFYREHEAKAFLKRIWGRKPVFLCVIGVTETAKIPGISAAGKTPELTDYTPPADVEYLLLGKCICIPGVPVTPEGIPTPALITRVAVRLADIPVFIVGSGLRIEPRVPFFKLAGSPGRDIRTGRAVKGVKEVLSQAEILGTTLAKLADYLIIGESIPGGTTTALAVTLAMGFDTKGKVSSSMPDNPHELKVKTVLEGLKAAGLRMGDLREKPIEAISHVGDPMMPAFAGLVMGAARRIPVLMAGGTQMGAILAIINALNPDTLTNVAIGTTKWIVADRSSDLKGIVKQITDIPILAANLDFSESRFEGLKAYERGVVKEGVGAGGAVIAAIAKTRGTVTCREILKEVEEDYRRLIRIR